MAPRRPANSASFPEREGRCRSCAAEMARPSLTGHYLSRLWPYAD